MANKLAVIALGGNALLRGEQKGTIEEQEKNTYDTLKNVVYLMKEGYDIILNHGNGPQVGNILMRNDAGEEVYNIPQMPLDVCVADSQGGIGYMIERMLRNVMIEEGVERDIITIVTQVIVDKNDNAFQNLTKPVGRVYPKEQADILTKEKGWVFAESAKKDGYRRVVASPQPIDIVNLKTIESLARSGAVVIAGGGGGIPVYVDEDKKVRPLEAVIDKDNVSSLMASKIGADEFYILTDVPFVYIDFATPEQRELKTLNKADAEQYLKEGKFGEGSMAPKIRASLRFVENGGGQSIITESTKLEDKSFGTKITLN